MIKQVSHSVAGASDAAGFALALAVAYELHAPTAPVRAPEVATPAAAGRTARRRRVRA